jgi:glycosyltransferase involved in cell wall biosynthesis
MLISIILPVLNEAESECNTRIDLLLPPLKGYRYEIIVVDDSSDDKFLSLKKEIGSRQYVRLIKGDRKGKGAAIGKAALESLGDIVFYMDIDFRIPLNNIGLFIDLIGKQGYDLVIAQRPFNKTPRTLLRLFLSFALFSIVRLLVFNSTFFFDTQCGFKAFKGEVLKKLAKRQIVNGGMFDVEYLYMARFNKFKLGKVAVQPLPEIRDSRIDLWKCLFCDGGDLVKIKARGILGQYKI